MKLLSTAIVLTRSKYGGDLRPPLAPRVALNAATTVCSTLHDVSAPVRNVRAAPAIRKLLSSNFSAPSAGLSRGYLTTPTGPRHFSARRTVRKTSPLMLPSQKRKSFLPRRQPTITSGKLSTTTRSTLGLAKKATEPLTSTLSGNSLPLANLQAALTRPIGSSALPANTLTDSRTGNSGTEASPFVQSAEKVCTSLYGMRSDS